MSDTTATHASPQTDHDADYATFERLIAERVAAARGPLFTTDATGLFEAYLEGIPGATLYCNACGLRGSVETSCTSCRGAGYVHYGPRQHYNCLHCAKFIERYGGLVSIDDDGHTVPILWAMSNGEEPKFFNPSCDKLYVAVRKATVTGVFVNGEATWGTPFNVVSSGDNIHTGKPRKYQGTQWSHLHGITTLPTLPGKTGKQEMAEYKQNFGILKHGLADYPLEAVAQAVRVLERGDAVDRSEKVLGVAKWLLDLHERLVRLPGMLRGTQGELNEGARRRDGRRDNLIWLAVATAPPGWCHVRSTMISTLLDDIVAGVDFNTMKRRWDAKMHPLQYQRPTAEVSDGQIEAANKIMEKLGAAGALERRYARLDEVTALWRPNIGLQEAIARDEALRQDNLKGGAFDNLRKEQSGIKAVELPPKQLHWIAFKEIILHSARSIEVLLTGGLQPFYGLVTSARQTQTGVPDHPPMLQWDGLVERDTDEHHGLANPLPRNPVSWYFWHRGSTAASWGLITPSNGEGVYDTHARRVGWWQKVDAIMLKPCHWQRHFDNQSDDIFFAIGAARDSRQPGGGYFPEMLRSDYHGIRKVIEEHSRKSKLAPLPEGVLGGNGIALVPEGTLTVRVDGGDSYVLSL